MPSSAILVPLYIYPLLGAWNPLYEVIEANPTTQFQVVINPHNGPGATPLPDSNYCREIPKLRSHPNVVVYGYVNVVWATRDLDEVCKDVEIYAAWPQHWHHHHHDQMNLQTQHDTKQAPQHQDQNVSVPIGIDGVFVDETPIDAGDHEKKFLGTLKTLVESHFGAKKKAAAPGQKYPLIIHNPGCMPPPAIRELADLTVVFEDTYAVFLQRLAQGVLALPNGTVASAGNDEAEDECNDTDTDAAKQERLRRAVVIHSVPLPDIDAATNLTAAQHPLVPGSNATIASQEVRAELVRDLVRNATEVAGTVFITELSSGFYETFSRGWREWAGVIGSGTVADDDADE
ncbi:uncharacterized protein AB675_359 [Cyphellophora attinorum]|uniref:Spherulin-4 n=1 Tax=Cyphellophora attinorum TaxID=1664694 RepID=A0A0N0NS62_9EURO|nr:uncharacterized protein AB675_359 [Phialophora attinorum]KPI45888.1 hypothetical protein AB675_359 [Phialophora attinorum]